VLHLAGNRLQALPNSMVHLTQLEFLYLNRNQFCVLPDFVCSLSNLKWLSLYKNSLGSLPAEISSLKNLKYLALADNPVTELSSWIASLPEGCEVWARTRLEIPPNAVVDGFFQSPWGDCDMKVLIIKTDSHRFLGDEVTQKFPT
jgi:hypothetical protein